MQISRPLLFSLLGHPGLLFTVFDLDFALDFVHELLLLNTERADVDNMEEKKSGIDMFYPVINYYGANLDNIYLSIDINYPKSTK